jgi:hypothetical protein
MKSLSRSRYVGHATFKFCFVFKTMRFFAAFCSTCLFKGVSLVKVGKTSTCLTVSLFLGNTATEQYDTGDLKSALPLPFYRDARLQRVTEILQQVTTMLDERSLRQHMGKYCVFLIL